MRLFRLPILGKVSTILAVAAMFSSLTGCPKQSISTSESVSVGPSGTTSTSKVGYTFTWGGDTELANLSPDDLESVSPTGGAWVVLLPQYFSVNSNDPVQAAFAATTDTGYASSITVSLQPGGPTGAAPSGYTAYPFEVASADQGALSAWLAQVGANTSASANISIAKTVSLTEVVEPGTSTLTSEAADSSGNVYASASASIYNPPPSTGCGDDPNVKCTKP
jgi:hypothetical protein